MRRSTVAPFDVACRFLLLRRLVSSGARKKDTTKARPAVWPESVWPVETLSGVDPSSRPVHGPGQWTESCGSEAHFLCDRQLQAAAVGAVDSDPGVCRCRRGHLYIRLSPDDRSDLCVRKG